MSNKVIVHNGGRLTISQILKKYKVNHFLDIEQDNWVPIKDKEYPADIGDEFNFNFGQVSGQEFPTYLASFDEDHVLVLSKQ